MFIKLSGLNHSYSKKEQRYVLDPIGPVWVNADRVATLFEVDGGTEITLSGRDSAVYVSETPEQIINRYEGLL